MRRFDEEVREKDESGTPDVYIGCISFTPDGRERIVIKLFIFERERVAEVRYHFLVGNWSRRNWIRLKQALNGSQVRMQ